MILPSSIRCCLAVVTLLLFLDKPTSAFVLTRPRPTISTSRLTKTTKKATFHRPLSLLESTASSSDSRKKRTNNNNNNNKKRRTGGNPAAKKHFSLNDLREEIQKNPAAFLQQQEGNKKSKYRRSRRRAENPKQQYVYARQRKELQKNIGGQDGGGDTSTTTTKPLAEGPIPVALAREYGLRTVQHCDPLVDDVEPEILGKIRVEEESTRSGSFAYIIHKPIGWSILGSGGSPSSNKGKSSNAATSNRNGSEQPKRGEKGREERPMETGVIGGRDQQIVRLEVIDVDGTRDVLEYSEADVLAVMTPDEIEEYKAEMSPTADLSKSKVTRRVKVRDDDDDDGDDEGDDLSLDEIEAEERALLAELTPEELQIYLEEGGVLPDMESREIPESTSHIEETAAGEDVVPKDDNTLFTERTVDPNTAEVHSKIKARKEAATSNNRASFSPFSRPSVVAWLKDLKAKEGSPMKGGKYWTALAGATDVEDSGIVILSPRALVDNVFVDYLEYVAVIGNGNCLASKPKGVLPIAKNEMEVDILSTLRRNREGDAIQTVKVMVAEKFSSCGSIIQACQDQFQDGIRGDPSGNPLGRLAHRRLVHCNAVSVSSLIFDESVEVETDSIPDDIAVLADRRNQHQYKQGSFLGRSNLRANPLTTAYREINGDGDGVPGWTVDRYDKWLFVQHDETMPRGPLPSIHDGNTAGVYYLPANPDRSAMGSSPGATSVLTRPQLLEGQAAPPIISILENGVTYHVSLDKDLSTGLFLDQRPQRAWLSRNCNEDTHVLNCFAHCGGFSIAAATAGASTTSLDLNKKWLDRVKPQMKANGISWDRHDCIYGDCFDWLAKLAKRGEKYDIVILDPPSASVGGKKKKRFGVKSDMPELVTLAAKVVKKGGLLWTSCNNASIKPIKFARLCHEGLEDAGYAAAKLERVQPMPHDFPSVGPQPVKNYVWRLP